MGSGFRNEGEMRSAQTKPLIDTRNIRNYRKKGHSWLTYFLLLLVTVVWVTLILAENGHV